jgi:hypothetical protein
MRKNSKKKNKKSNYNYINLIYKGFLFFLILFILLKYKPLIFVILFEVLDVIKNIMRKTMLYFPLDLAYIFGVTLAYHYNFSMGVFIYVLSLINKIILGRIQVRHLANSLRLIPIFFIASKFTMFPFLIVASILLIINYILKYVFRIAVRSSNAYDTLPFHIANYIISLTFITLLNTVITFMPLIVS